jgi:hypothetical protein
MFSLLNAYSGAFQRRAEMPFLAPVIGKFYISRLLQASTKVAGSCHL